MQESSFHSLLFSKTLRSAFSAPHTPHVRKRGSSSSSSANSSSSMTPSSAIRISPPPPSVPATSNLSEKSRRHHRNTPPLPLGGSTELATNGWTGTEKEVRSDWLIDTLHCLLHIHCLLDTVQLCRLRVHTQMILIKVTNNAPYSSQINCHRQLVRLLKKTNLVHLCVTHLVQISSHAYMCNLCLSNVVLL